MKSLHGDPKGGRIKAPPNGFVLFRSDYKAIPENQVTANGRRKKETEITKDAAAAWKELPQITRDDYLSRARKNLAEHKREHRDYWSQRRGRDGRFVGTLEPDSQEYSQGGGEPDGVASALLCPLTFAGPFPSPGSLPRLTTSFASDPGFVPGPLVPASHSLPTAPSFPVPFNGMAPVNAPLQAPPFNPLPGTSSNQSRSFSFPTLSNSDAAMFSAPATATAYDHTQSLSPTMDYSTSFHTTYPSLASGRLGDPLSVGNDTMMSLQPPLQSMQDLSSRTLTLSDSEWEAIDLFLSVSGPSQVSANAVRP
ncbi:transcription factor [Ganoderma sinense ZZ0214-1]|uniref:Transcription factor n=1 Tax=Ganoderma sinense ZZ0214-1 TaxID=1077348 RepID=A0A2G8SGC2_9APHY|nr:transcription factor [Ganoderma sinense ZZ0214-1]